MRIFLAAGAALAAAVLVACEKNEETNSARLNGPPAQPLQPNASHRTTFQIQNPMQEYQRLCHLLFNQGGNACNTILPSQAIQTTPSQHAGLNAYTRGILNNNLNYSYENAQSRWSRELQALEGAQYYLSGHGGCTETNKDTPNRPCYPINSGQMAPAIYDFVDDYSNLMGAFFFLQSQKALFSNPQTRCTLGIATLGSDEEPFCHAFTMHNIVLTPLALSLRAAQANLVEASCGVRP